VGGNVVLAIGGGSVLDAGKAVAALAANGGSVIEYLEDVGRGAPRPLLHPPLPVVAVPTTCGSGSETTRNSVVRVPELQVKRSLRSDLLLPRVAIIDPELAEGAPLAVAAAAGLAVAVLTVSIAKSWLLRREIGHPVSGWRLALAFAAVPAFGVGLGVQRLPEWVQLSAGLVAILGTFGALVWWLGFGPNDRLLFRRARPR